MAKVFMALAPGFEEIETLTVVDILRRAEIEVVLGGLMPGPVAGAHNVSIIPDSTIDAVNVGAFDMLILPGGQPGTDNLNADQRIHKLLKEFAAKEKLIGAICAAPIVLAAAGLLNGKKVTCYPSYRDQLSGGIYEEAPVVSDGSFITSQGPGTAIQFGLAIVTRLAGRHTSDGIAKAMLVKHTSAEIWNPGLFSSTIQAMLGALEMKDSYTQGQAQRVAEYCLSIGSRLKLPIIEMRDLYLGAMLHDIGKYNTAEDVLNKPDSLNLREETLTREHTLKGTLFVVGINNISHIGPTILHHHEHWDGSGYPGRLKGEQIPLHARIVAVADAYDAMTSNRSYRDGLDKETAMRELLKKKDSQFDPFIVDIFIECLNDSPFEIKDFSYYF
ncbi:MAG: DJ-1/PfpI family protein [Desulfuromonadaceae bacterium]|nr:DJ-1/PfpI family protein [Desulfuromonadaceae bacterium]MDD2846894.1 DJ-1/PfpI family protein [Desulfuromonadaceae bacterium]MDD4129128.1 DJ-1/PfpI family protein [Desulfuromonadaceae bacterium]